MLVHAIHVHNGHVTGFPIVADAVVNFVADAIENIKRGLILENSSRVQQGGGVFLPEQVVEIFKQFTVEAAHRLPNLPENHKCRRLHGHSIRIEIHVSGPLTEKEGWVMDFADLTRAFNPVYEQLDIII